MPSVDPSIFWTALCGAVAIVIIFLLRKHQTPEPKSNETSDAGKSTITDPAGETEAKAAIIPPSSPRVHESKQSSFTSQSTETAYGEHKKISSPPRKGNNKKQESKTDESSLPSRAIESKTSKTEKQETETTSNNTMEMENNWRCACEGGFLPPGLLKTFGGAEAVFKLGTGDCYHKQI